jgi:FG-GAP repeat
MPRTNRRDKGPVDGMSCYIITGDLTGNIIGQDPQLGPLQENGGPTLTRALSGSSPALNGGNPGGCLDHAGAQLPRDQRGYARSQQGRCDIGAFESGIRPARGIGDYNGNGRADILFRHTSGSLYTWFMDGLSVSSEGAMGGVDGTWTVQGAGGFNGDGKADILWRHALGHHLCLAHERHQCEQLRIPGQYRRVVDRAGHRRLQRGRQGRRPVAAHFRRALHLVHERHQHCERGPGGGATADWTIRGVGDFNGDGKADILWRNTSGVVYVWLMNGTGSSASGSPGDAGPD